MSLGASNIYHTEGSGVEVMGINNVLVFVHVNGTGYTVIHMSGGDQVKENLKNSPVNTCILTYMYKYVYFYDAIHRSVLC